MKARIGKELMFANAAIGRKLEWTILTVDATLREASNSTRNGLQEAIVGLGECGSSLQQDINETESRYMRSLAHAVMSNAWSSALSEAMRVMQQSSRDNQNLPPVYVPSDNERQALNAEVPIDHRHAEPEPVDTAR
ncbi:unnamed protein product [Tilletia caries]|uniref:Phasin domain-containing protein n=1 Tax=Tilletia caries TaxID=13290 RepID=A0ABN7IYI8_9BASI|nr:unnamed protein product [Tilletia caries]